ncbi:MAG: BlaI/MecI/CopY family transcriptional regulator [Pseudomonadota bacterium]
MSSVLDTLLTGLRQDNPIKAWSLITTFFGDSIAPRGGAVSATTIQSVMAHCGIGQGTVRTALSRLGKDGWVEREKSGRNSYYRLSPRAAKQSAGASALIYAAPDSNHTQPPLYLVKIKAPNSLAAQSADFLVNLQHNMYLAGVTDKQKTALQERGALLGALDNQGVPGWVAESMLPKPLSDKYLQLQRRLGGIDQPGAASETDALALRTVIIHEWRRLRLRPEQPAADHRLCPTVRNDAHRTVADLYRQLTPAADRWMQNNATGPDGLLSITDTEIAGRFR